MIDKLPYMYNSINGAFQNHEENTIELVLKPKINFCSTDNGTYTLTVTKHAE